jgi:uncharacterized membrane protein
MRRLLTWLLVSFGIAAVARRLRRRERYDELAPADDADPAAELRQKLAESRSEEETAAAAPLSPEASVQDRRASVHEQGRAAMNEMRDSDAGDET